MKVIVCGDRDWSNPHSIYDELTKLPRDTTIIHGDAPGADTLASLIATQLGFTDIRKYPANWRDFGRSAGPIRNRQMFNENHPDLVLAFHPDLAKSKGTKDMVFYAKKQGCVVKVITQ